MAKAEKGKNHFGHSKGQRSHRLLMKLETFMRQLEAAHGEAVAAQKAAIEAQGFANNAQGAANRAQKAAQKAQRVVSLAMTRWGLLPPEERKSLFDAERPDFVQPRKKLGWRARTATARACDAVSVFGRRKAS